MKGWSRTGMMTSRRPNSHADLVYWSKKTTIYKTMHKKASGPSSLEFWTLVPGREPRDLLLSGSSPLGLRFRLFFSLMPSLTFLSPPSLQGLAFSLLLGTRSASRRTGPGSLGAPSNTHTSTRWRYWDPPPAYQTLTGSV